MTQEEKQLLLKDLCARLPYKVKVQWITKDTDLLGIIDDIVQIGYDINDYDVAAVEDIKPYLRPMSSMTEEEIKYILTAFFQVVRTDNTGLVPMLSGLKSFEYIDWLNSHHFDYRGLIEKRLALEAPEEIYGKI